METMILSVRLFNEDSTHAVLAYTPNHPLLDDQPGFLIGEYIRSGFDVGGQKNLRWVPANDINIAFTTRGKEKV